jgi:carboxymethylenebutenolidase
MGGLLTITANDGHTLQAYVAAPSGVPRAAIVVLQEIFGINAHMRAVTDGFADEGYLAVAPSVFDRVRPGISLEHTPAGIEAGIGYAMQLETPPLLADMGAAVERAAHVGPVGAVGYCFGGRLAYMAACHLPLACCVSYYGGNIPQLLGDTPRCPVLYHFAERDKYIPLSDAEKIRQAHPEGIFHLYAAEHGFSSEDRAEYDPACAALARRRTLDFLTHHFAGPRGSVRP